MAVKTRIIEESSIRLWDLSARERLQRMLNKYGVTDISGEESDPVSVDDTVLLLRGDFLYDQRIIKNLVGTAGIVLETGQEKERRPVAAHVTAQLADQMQAILTQGTVTDYPEDLKRETPETLVSSYLMELRKFDTPYLLPIRSDNRKKLEKRLFDGSYKGVTDLVTKWVWPTPARWAVGLCTRYGIVPNQVTTLSLVLSILAVFLFYTGFYGTGLILAWFMTYLDTVDGKLARVTINYSPLGNIYDHAIDLVFPPIWYIVWGLSLQSVPGISLQFALWMVLVGYTAGRLVEVIFKQGLESSGIFCWKPIDSCFRLITGRRNPNLILLTFSLFLGRPDIGFLAVCLWTVLSSIFLIARLFMGIYARITTGPLRSWFLDLDPTDDTLSFSQRWFCRRPEADSVYE